MIKKYCDRCGKEVLTLYDVSIAQQKLSDGRCVQAPKQFCKNCKEFVEEAIKQFNSDMVDVRIAFCKALLSMGGKEDETDL